jgi:hypothetical protein
MPKVKGGSLLSKSCQVFSRVGERRFSSNGVTLSLHQRQEYTPKKPRLYLMYAPSGQPFKYLTGLYPQPDGTFIGENKGVYWRVSLTDDAIEMQVRGKEETTRV